MISRSSKTKDMIRCATVHHCTVLDCRCGKNKARKSGWRNNLKPGSGIAGRQNHAMQIAAHVAVHEQPAKIDVKFRTMDTGMRHSENCIVARNLTSTSFDCCPWLFQLHPRRQVVKELS